MTSPITITLNMIRECGPCAAGWEELLASKGKTKADDDPFPLADVLDSNGLDDCLWCLRCLETEHAGWIRHYAVDCAENVAHLFTDERSLEALRVARRFADGGATKKELDAAGAVARDAAGEAVREAAREAARDAAREAAWAAAWKVAGAAAGAAAGEAARAVQADRLRLYLAKGGRP